MAYKIDPRRDREVVDEFRQNPIGHHSPNLQRVLNALRGGPLKGKYVLVCTRPFAEWVLARHPGERGQPLELLPRAHLREQGGGRVGGVPAALAGAHRRGAELTRRPQGGSRKTMKILGYADRLVGRAGRDRALHGELQRRRSATAPRSCGSSMAMPIQRARAQARAGRDAGHRRVSGARAGDRRRLLPAGAGSRAAAGARELHGRGDDLADHARARAARG